MRSSASVSMTTKPASRNRAAASGKTAPVRIGASCGRVSARVSIHRSTSSAGHDRLVGEGEVDDVVVEGPRSGPHPWAEAGGSNLHRSLTVVGAPAVEAAP